MSSDQSRLKHAPIIEAVVDLDCELPVDQDLQSLKDSTVAAFQARYPESRTQYLNEVRLEAQPDGPPVHTSSQQVIALQQLSQDEKQLVQVRTAGFSFNRLSPYESLDTYLPDLKSGWESYVGIAKPVEVREIRLRYINVIKLPFDGPSLELSDYFSVGPRLFDESRLTLTKFLLQHIAIDNASNHQVKVTLTDQPIANDVLPIILDIEVAGHATLPPSDWQGIWSLVSSLRTLKNRVFFGTVTEKCINLFQS